MDVLDSRELKVEDSQYTFRLDLLDDYSEIEDEDCYDEDAQKRFHNSDWQFVTLKVTASKAGIELGSDYMGGVEYGHFGQHYYFDIDYIIENNDYIPDMIANATEEADAMLKRLMEVAK